MKAKTTRRALLLSVLSLLLCCSMLVGTTFAWFTDSVTSGRNTIVAGNLDVVLEYWDGDSYEEVTSTTKLFDDEALWEPGYTEVAYLKVSNAGSLALKYQLAVTVFGETLGKTKTDADIKLSDYLQFKVVESDTDLAGTYASREAAQAADATATKLQSYSSDVKPLDPKDGANDEDYVALIIYMPTTIGNEANHDGTNIPKIEMGVNLFATQQTAESDSFNDQYDKDAEYVAEVKNADELAAALKLGGKVKLANDITTGASLAIPAGVTVDLDLNGNQLTFAGAAGEYTISNEGATLTINGGEVEGVIYTAPSSKTIVNGGTFRARQGEKYVFLNNQGTLEINGGTVYGGTSYPIYSYNANNKLVINDVVVSASFGCVNAYGLGGVVEINGGKFEMTGVQGKTSHIAYFSNVDVTINGGNFNKIGDINMSATGGGGVCAIYGADVTVNGGVFNGDYEDIYNWGGTNANGRASKITLKGGTFSVNPNASFVAPGYQVTNNGNGTYTINDN